MLDWVDFSDVDAGDRFKFSMIFHGAFTNRTDQYLLRSLRIGFG
jgi:hypothetical protein